MMYSTFFSFCVGFQSVKNRGGGGGGGGADGERSCRAKLEEIPECARYYLQLESTLTLQKACSENNLSTVKVCAQRSGGGLEYRVRGVQGSGFRV